MTEEQINQMAQVVRQSLMEDLESQSTEIAWLKSRATKQDEVLVTQGNDMLLQQNTRMLQIKISSLSQELLKLKRRVLVLENRLSEAGLSIA